jgi:hypothetical protein
MGMLYAWATKEYLLWNMTIGQIFLYYQNAKDIKSGKTTKSEISKSDIEELKKIRESMKQQYGDIE